MSVTLLDVNVLVALFDQAHVHFEQAHRWLALNMRLGWATCPITINGCIRVLSNPSYPSFTASAAEVATRIRAFCASSHHHFWPDSISLADNDLFDLQKGVGYSSCTDVYLLGLAVRNHGRLATFDRSIPLRAVRGAASRHLQILQRS